MDHHRSGNSDDRLALLFRLPRERRGLTDSGLHLALGGDFVRHEREGEAVALLRFGRDADAVHARHHHVAGLEIAQPPAGRLRSVRSTTIIASMR